MATYTLDPDVFTFPGGEVFPCPSEEYSEHDGSFDTIVPAVAQGQKA